LVENSLKNVFFSFILTIKAKYFMCLKKKPIPNEKKKKKKKKKKKDLIVGHCIIFSNFFFLSNVL
jgi:hypothetical protein